MVERPAPIALFAYNRLWHLQKTVEALLENPLAEQSRCIVFSDGPKNDDDRKQIDEVRTFLHGISGFKDLQIVAHSNNLGLSASLIGGITSMVEAFGQVIVIEDDILVGKSFLSYMNDALSLYEQEERVASIHGYIYPMEGVTLPETFFLRGADCWGWATWHRGWRLFNPDAAILLAELRRKQLESEFNLENAYDFTGMLEASAANRNDSWAIRWHASAFLNDKLTLYPGRSLVRNIGIDRSGTHCGKNAHFDVVVDHLPINVSRIPIQENVYARKAVTAFFRQIRGPVYVRVLQHFRNLWVAMKRRKQKHEGPWNQNPSEQP
jgi:hypothetical protein